MSFHKQHNCLYLTKIIAIFSFTSFIACDHCLAILSSCIIMTDYTKCFECICYDCLCMLILLNSLNHAHLWLKSELEMTINECVKILHLFKTLKQNKSHTIVKVCSVASELSDDNNETENEKNSFNSFNLDSLLKSMSFNFFINLKPFSQTAVVFLHSWVDFLWVLMCFLMYCILFIWWDSELSH